MYLFWIYSVQALLIENEYDLNTQQSIGKFSGSNVTIELNCRLGSESKGNVEVRFDVNEDIVCGVSGKVLGVGKEWTEDLRMELGEGNFKFFLKACGEGGENVEVKFSVTDNWNGHYSSEFEYIYFALVFAGVLQLILIFSSIFGVYKENYEEVPLALTFVMSLLFCIAIMFQFLYVWIYGVDGNSFKFILIFSKFFEIFARVSLLGILFLISSNRFNPSDFSIEETEFAAFLLMIGAEFLIEIIAIIRFDVLNQIEMWSSIEGLLFVIFRVFIVLFVNRKSNVKLGARLNGFARVDKVIMVFMALPLVLILVTSLGFSKAKATIIFSIEHLAVVWGLLCLQVKFLSINFAGVLPLKSHNF